MRRIKKSLILLFFYFIFGNTNNLMTFISRTFGNFVFRVDNFDFYLHKSKRNFSEITQKISTGNTRFELHLIVL